MKTNCIKTRWWILLSGIAFGAAGLLITTEYLALERKNRSEAALATTLDRLWLDQQLCSVLKLLEDGDASVAALHLDLRVCGDVVAVNSQLASTDDRTRMIVRNAFRNLAPLRPKNAPTLAGAGPELYYDQIAAERILAAARAENIFADVATAPP